MSTVLWANVLVDGRVRSDQADHPALYKHADKLDALTRSLKLQPFLEICDTTDHRFNIENTELPPGMVSTDDLMADQGAWMTIGDAVPFLEMLRDQILVRNERFGLVSNRQAEVLAELDEVLAFVRSQLLRAEKFNFSVVM